jgi:hypothetical protein
VLFEAYKHVHFAGMAVKKGVPPDDIGRALRTLNRLEKLMRYGPDTDDDCIGYTSSGGSAGSVGSRASKRSRASSGMDDLPWDDGDDGGVDSDDDC